MKYSSARPPFVHDLVRVEAIAFQGCFLLVKYASLHELHHNESHCDELHHTPVWLHTTIVNLLFVHSTVYTETHKYPL